jgi:hypothetical protein
MTPVRGGQMNIDHLHDVEFLQRRARCQTWSRALQLVFEPAHARHPPRVPLPQVLQLHFAQAHAHRLGVTCPPYVFPKQRDLTFGTIVEHLDRLAPGELLGIVDLAQVQHLAPHDVAVHSTDADSPPRSSTGASCRP